MIFFGNFPWLSARFDQKALYFHLHLHQQQRQIICILYILPATLVGQVQWTCSITQKGQFSSVQWKVDWIQWETAQSKCSCCCKMPISPSPRVH